MKAILMPVLYHHGGVLSFTQNRAKMELPLMNDMMDVGLTG